MHPLSRWRRMALAAGLLLTLTAPALAADDKTPSDPKAGDRVLTSKALYDAAADGKPTDSKALDRYLYTSLRFVINHGVDLYNAGRVDECYEHFRQSLDGLVPVLAHHPDLQKAVKEGLDKAEKDADWRVKMAAKATMPNPQLAPLNRQKAFALRAVFNDVRAALSPEPPKPVTLWDKLGGEKGVKKVVDDFTDLAASDPKVDFTRGGKYKLDALAVEDFKKKMVELVSANTGGPLRYTGKSMKDVHKGMGITDAEFDAAAADLKKALAKNNVKAADADALLKIVETTRKDIVEPKKPAGDTGTVEGTVLLDGKPVAKAKVTFHDKDGKAVKSLDADDAGKFTAENLPVDTYKVTVTGTGVPTVYGDPKNTDSAMNLKVGKGTSVTFFGLKSGADEGTIKGKVMLDGKPLAKGKVTLTDKDGKAHSADVVADGSYKLEKVPPGAYQVSVTDAKGVPAKYGDPKTSGIELTVKKGANEADFQLKGEKKPEEKNPDEVGTVSGKVTYKGQPLPGGTVIFHPKEGKPVSAPIKEDLSAQPGAPAGGAAPAPPTMRVRLFNLQYVIKHYKRTEVLRAEHTDLFKQYDAQIKTIKDNIEGRTRQLQDRKLADEREAIEKEIKRLEREMADKTEEARIALDKKQDELIVLVYKEVDEAVSKFAKQGGIELVMHYNDAVVESDRNSAANITRKMSAGACMPMYITPSLDISQDIVNALNAKYPDGSYSADKLPVGEYTVTVETESLKPAAPPKGIKPPDGKELPKPGDAPKYVKIPAKYADPKTSDLTLTVKGGKQTWDLDLTD